MKLLFNDEQEKAQFMVRTIHLLYAIIKLTEIQEAIIAADNLIVMVNNSEVQTNNTNKNEK